MAAVRQYYCYQCMNQTQADSATFTCRRCGGGFIQEMPDDPFPPPRDNIAGDQPNRRVTSTGPRANGSGPQGDFFRPMGMRMQFPNQQSGMPPGGNFPAGIRPNMVSARSTSVPGHNPRPFIQGQMTITQHVPVPEGMGQAYNAQRSMSFPMGQPRPPVLPGQMQFVPGPPPMMHVPQQWQPRMMSIPVAEMAPGVPVPMAPMMPPPAGMPPMMPPGGVGPQPQVTIPLQMPFFRPANMNPNMNASMNPNIHPNVNHQGQVPPSLASQGQEAQAQGQQDGLLLVGVGTEENGQPNIQNVFQIFGGPFNNIMENLEEAVTTLLNQLAQHGGAPPITQEDVDRIPTQAVTKEMVGENKSCSICLENFNVTEPFKELACTHQFHGSCIDRWLLIHGNCPICRAHFGPENNNQNAAEGVWMQQFADAVAGNNAGLVQHIPNVIPHIHIRPAQQQLPPRGPNLWFGQGQQPAFAPQQPQQNTTFAFQPMYQNQNMARGGMGGPVRMQEPFFAQQQPAGRVQMANLGGSSANQAPNAHDAVVWSGQVYLNDPARPTIVLDMQVHPQQPGTSRPGGAARPTAQQQPPNAQPRVADQHQQGPRMVNPANPQNSGQNQAGQGIPQFLQSLVGSITQAFRPQASLPANANPPARNDAATASGGNTSASSSGPSGQSGISDMSEATYTSPNQQSANQRGNQPPNRNLQDDLDFD
ncbi:uncharacterized protein LOC129586249 [Paramacrobiotus metropolitanus]|uniref:uncharacterized protein LOC129586249 n=1 Tax=Paramacrobiotus metropolitanus TaxID=2943436 RepID=UPI002445ACD9|nr:uncharacterized protein LOC129586249 [Paramacrobiotus metropolitanus]XP_055335332.1 uncharacterized protein LOC129586249 [Paramacrobiotus metropolitanus]